MAHLNGSIIDASVIGIFGARFPLFQGSFERCESIFDVRTPIDFYRNRQKNEIVYFFATLMASLSSKGL